MQHQVHLWVRASPADTWSLKLILTRRLLFTFIDFMCKMPPPLPRRVLKFSLLRIHACCPCHSLILPTRGDVKSSTALWHDYAGCYDRLWLLPFMKLFKKIVKARVLTTQVCCSLWIRMDALKRANNFKKFHMILIQGWTIKSGGNWLSGCDWPFLMYRNQMGFANTHKVKFQCSFSMLRTALPLPENDLSHWLGPAKAITVHTKSAHTNSIS